MPLSQSELLEVKRIPGKGRGVFARRDIPKGETIERVPVLVMPEADLFASEAEAKLSSYVYAWGKNTVALALGYGSLYNHSYRPNARYDDEGQLTKVFTALRRIRRGEEITVNYNGEPRSRDAVWFDVVE